MALSSKDNLFMGRRMVLASIFGQISQPLKANGKKMSLMDMVSILGLMAANIQVIGS